MLKDKDHVYLFWKMSRAYAPRQTAQFFRGIKAALEKLDYKVFVGVLNAADYQVPQQRA